MPLQGPSFLVHKGNQTAAVIEQFLEDVAQVVPARRVGASIFLPRLTPTTSETTLRGFDVNGAYTLADPETHKLGDPFDQRGVARHHLAYLQESDPRANRQRFVQNVLQAEVDAGADALISPWLTHGIVQGQRNLRATIRFAEISASHALAQDRTLLYGLAATEDVIEDDADRGDLLDEIIELPDGAVYFRLRITPPTSYTQYGDRDALTGLRGFCEALRDNGREVLLPQMGLAGWVMMPFGALSFGSGINASLQRFVAPSTGFGQPLPWYFMPQLLGFVLRTEYDALAQVTGFVDCDCPYCGQLPLGTGGPWSAPLAGQHYLWWCARLADEISSAADPVAALRQRLAEAQAFWQDAQAAFVVLDERSEPRHLAAWSAVAA